MTGYRETSVQGVPGMWLLQEPVPTNQMFKCAAYMKRGTPEQCLQETPFLLDSDGAHRGMVPVCRNHMETAYNAYVLIYGSCDVWHHATSLVPRRALVKVAPDALPTTCLRSSNCNLTDGHEGDCNLVYP